MYGLWCLKPDLWIKVFISWNHLRIRGGGRHSRAGPSRLVASDCSESIESRAVFLDCQDLRLASVPASNTWSLEPDHLLLARNRIKVLRDGAFNGFEGLKSLDLQQNQIYLVQEGAFQGLTRLRTLMLQHNRLGTLSEEALIPMPNLRYLRLHDNPWNCHCPLDSLIRTIQVPSNRNLGNYARWMIPRWDLNKEWFMILWFIHSSGGPDMEVSR